MAFTYTIIKQTIFGHVRTAFGTFVNTGGSTGGSLNLHQECGWHTCKHLTLQHTGSATVVNTPTVNTTLPCDASSITIITDPDTTGCWKAIGV